MASDGVTNWKAVSPEHKRKISPIVKHYMKQAHPFTACVRDNTKRFGEDRAKKICAVVKDMGERTTKWRSGGDKKVREAAIDETAYMEMIFDDVMVEVLDAEGVTVGELAAWADSAQRAGILEAAPTGTLLLELADDEVGDLGLLIQEDAPYPMRVGDRVRRSRGDLSLGRTAGTVAALGSDPSDGVVTHDIAWDDGTTSSGVRGSDLRCVSVLEAGFTEWEHPRDLFGKFTKKVKALKPGEAATLPDGIKVRRTTDPIRPFTVEADGKTEGLIGADAKGAASMAMLRSAQSTDPKSLGGPTPFDSLADLRRRLGINVVQTSRQAAISAAATGRAMRVAQQRHRRLSEASTPPPLSNAKRRPGESLTAYGRRLKAGDRANARAAQAKTRSGGSADFERKHPRGRGGSWTMKSGAAGTEVRTIQRRVGAKVDGKYGQLTRAAVMRYQRRHGLKVDGIVGKQTVASLRGDREAKNVQPGSMSAKDRAFLSKRAHAA